jgi:superoxide dismutase, Cu-Zn family
MGRSIESKENPMRIRSLAIAATAAGAVVAIATMGVSAQHPETKMEDATKAVAVLIPTKSGAGVSGQVIFTKTERGTHVRAEITGLTPGKHGFHVHEFGDASSPDGKAAGGHFNPKGSAVHGDPSKTGPRHLGDLGNIEADASGKATFDKFEQDLPLSGPHSIIGHGVVVHEKADDFGQPVGNAGGRVAVAVIGIAKGS